MNVKEFVRQIGSEITTTFFPNVCSSCAAEMHNESLICINCIRQLPYTQFETQKDNAVEKLFWGRFNFEKAYAMWYMHKDGIVNQLLHQLKYQDQPQVGEWIGELMAEQLRPTSWIHTVDGVIAVPLNDKKKFKRGYNQSEIIARSMALQLNKEYLGDHITRTVYTASQTKKSRTERLQNVDGVFEVVNTEPLKYKHLLLVDDVITTGATIESCVLALQQVEGVVISVAGACLAATF